MKIIFDPKQYSIIEMLFRSNFYTVQFIDMPVENNLRNMF